MGLHEEHFQGHISAAAAVRVLVDGRLSLRGALWLRMGVSTESVGV